VEWAHHLYSGEVVDAYLHFCWLCSRQLVYSDWPNIQKVAAALLERRTLRYLDMIEVIMPGSAALRASLKRSGLTR